MRILHVTDCFAPRLGGIERQVADLATRQRDSGHQVEIVTSVTGPASHGQVTVHRPVPVRGQRESTGIRYLSSGRGPRLVAEGRYDVIHVHLSCWSPLGLSAGRAASRLGVPTAVTVHSMWSVARVPLRMSAAVFDLRQWRAAWSAVSAPAAAAMQPTLGLAEISLLPNGVDRSFWQTPARVADSATVRLASVMRLSSRKRPRALLRMLATLRATVPARIRLEATIVGDGPLRSRLVSQAGALGLDGWVDFTGRLTRPQVRDVLAATDIYVAPAHLESFGIAALEARCAGLPIVGYRGTGIADFVDHGEHGLLASDDREMASALGTLAMDRALRERISERNRCEAPPATWSQVLAGCDELYQRAVSLTRRDTAMDAWPADAPASLAAS